MRDYLSWRKRKQFRKIVLQVNCVYIWPKASEISKASYTEKFLKNWTVKELWAFKRTELTILNLQHSEDSAEETEELIGWRIGAPLMMYSWAHRGNDRDKLLKSTWCLLTLWPMMLRSTISITHCDRAQISILPDKYRSHLFCFQPSFPDTHLSALIGNTPRTCKFQQRGKDWWFFFFSSQGYNVQTQVSNCQSNWSRLPGGKIALLVLTNYLWWTMVQL